MWILGLKGFIRMDREVEVETTGIHVPFNNFRGGT